VIRLVRYDLYLYAEPKTAVIGTYVKVYGYLYKDGAPLANATIKITYVDQILYPKTDSKGYFETNVRAVLYANVCRAEYWDYMGVLRATASVTITGTLPVAKIYVIKLEADKTMTTAGNPVKVYGYLYVDSTPVRNAPIEITYVDFKTTVVTNPDGYFETTIIARLGTFDVCASYYIPETRQLAARRCITITATEPGYTITLEVEKTSYVVGEDILVRGFLYKGGAPAGGLTVEVEMNGEVRLVSTYYNGLFSAAFKATKAGTFKITARYGEAVASKTITISPPPTEKYVAQITVSKKSPAANPTPGEPITFSGYVKDNEGKPVANQVLVIAEKDMLGRYWPIKNSAGQYIFARTDSNGYYELYDDDGWPDAGVKTVWAITNKTIGKDVRVDGLFGVVPANGELVFSEPLTITIEVRPAEYTHELRIFFIRLPWATKRGVEEAIPSIAAVVNPFITPLGYDYVGGSVNWEDRYISLYYRKRGTPAIPLVVIVGAIVGIAISVAIMIVGIAWYEQAKALETYYRSKTELEREALRLYEEGKLTYDQLQEVLKQIDVSLRPPEELVKCKLLGIWELPIPKEWCGAVNGVVTLGLAGLGIYAAYKIVGAIGKKK